MKEIKKFFGRDCHVVLTLSALLAMTMWACDGTEDGNQDADTCCDADVPTDQIPDGEVPVCAALEVNSTPSGAAIELDGEPTGKTTPAILNNVPAGAHTFTLTLDGYNAAPLEVDVAVECTPVNVILYPSVEGTWDLTYRNSEAGTESHHTLDLEQEGSLLTGWDERCEYTGSILATSEISLFMSNCGSTTSTITGSRTNSNHMEGNWYSSEGSSGIWWGDRR